jgi:hypothetical protein
MKKDRSVKNIGRAGRTLGLVIVLGLALGRGGFPQTVDCLLAVVNGHPVTLSDVRTLDAAGFFPGLSTLPEGDRLRAILDRAVDQRIVIDIAEEQVLIPSEKVEAGLRDLESRQPPAGLDRKLDALGLTRDDLKPYIEDMLLEREIINLRFGRSVAVSLKEIEDYYRQTYVPARKSAGLEPLPMLQVLSEVEELLKKDKIAAQAETWIKNLRRQGTVRLMDDCLKSVKED